MGRILFVDDVKDNLAARRLLLESQGLELAEVASCKDALAYLIEAAKVDAVLLGSSVAGTCGIDLCRCIRNDFELLFLPIIVIADQTVSSKRRAALYRAGCSSFILEPFEQEELLAVINSAVQIKSSTDNLIRECTEKRYKMLFDNSISAVIGLDEKGHITEWNRAAAELTGFRRDEVLGVSFGERFVKDSRERGVFEGLLQTTSEYTLKDKELSVQNKAGNSGTWSLGLSSLQPPGDSRTSTIVCATDITEQKQLKKQMRRAERMKSIGTLASGVAHDFNNILSVILGNLEFARDERNPNGAQDQFFDELFIAAERAKDLVRQILTFTRHSDDGFTATLLAPVIHEALSLIRASIPSSVEIVTNIAKDKTPTVANGTQVHEIIINLCANAVHAMEGKGVLSVALDEIEVDDFLRGAISVLGPGRYSRIIVSDTGVGMMEETSSRIFEPFFTTKGPNEGSGMGLAVVFGIMQHHNGEIIVRTQKNRGTTFELYFPLSHKVGMSPSTYDVEAELIRGNGRVLCVDDEKPIALLMRDVLSALGYSVNAFTDSSAALAHFLSEPDHFDLVITDLTMPGINGFELGEKVLFHRPKLPVILCSGYCTTSDAKRAKQMGFYELLSKPIARGHLSEVVHRALSE